MRIKLLMLLLLSTISSFAQIEVSGTGAVSSIVVSGTTKDECLKAIGRIVSLLRESSDIILVDECSESESHSRNGIGIGDHYLVDPISFSKFTGKIVFIKN